MAHAVWHPHGRANIHTAHLPERRKMIQEWANYLDRFQTGEDTEVTALQLWEALTLAPRPPISSDSDLRYYWRGGPSCSDSRSNAKDYSWLALAAVNSHRDRSRYHFSCNRDPLSEIMDSEGIATSRGLIHRGSTWK